MKGNASFERSSRIRFDQCDPAGIVFYPQYFILFNRLVEDWVSEGLRISYAELITSRRVGLPTVSQQTEFKAVSRIGDDLVLALQVHRLGGASLTLDLHCRGTNSPQTALRVSVRTVLVSTDLNTHRPIPLPDDLRAAIRRFQGAA